RRRHPSAERLARRLSDARVRHAVGEGRVRLGASEAPRAAGAAGLRAVAVVVLSAGVPPGTHPRALPCLLRSRARAAVTGQGRRRAPPLDLTRPPPPPPPHR